MSIWTHLLSFIYFSYNLVLLLAGSGEHYSSITRVQSVVILSIALLSINFCMLTSTLYHTFNCMGKTFFEYFLMFDLIGICFMIFTLGMVLTFNGFHNFQLFGDIAVSIMLFLMITILLLQSGACMTDSFEKYRICFYQFFLAALFLLGLSWACIFSTSQELSLFFGELLQGFGALFVGFFFYWSRIPEFFTKNYYVQIYSPSHMWWHVFVFLCGYKMYWLLHLSVFHIESLGDNPEPGLSTFN
mmetsp:Transcript_2448/g.2399  ORF Transcript_2448/g.2399 Transcript_2448/m.2399 type:complete len:244 (+) Transcript_2448:227-958(+)